MQKPTYESIRRLPIMELIKLSWKELDQLEKEISNEVSRAKLALAWIRGIKEYKRRRRNGGENG